MQPECLRQFGQSTIHRMKILLLGKDGQVGHELQRTLLPLGDVIAMGRQDANLEDPTSIERALHSHSPAIIVNAAAYTAVDKAESEENKARRINADAVALLAKYASRTKALLVHYSTDYVYDGQKDSPYVETDSTGPQSAYGRTKMEGEHAIVLSNCNALIFRTSWVFSAYGGNFIKTIMRLAGERDSLGIVADQFGAPTSAELIADVTALAVAAHKQLRPIERGIYHLAASGVTSWHGFATHVVEKLEKKGIALTLNASKVRAIGTDEYPLPAIRPKNSRLNTRKLSAALGLEIPHWTIYADRTIDQLTKTDKQ